MISRFKIIEASQNKGSIFFGKSFLSFAFEFDFIIKYFVSTKFRGESSFKKCARHFHDFLDFFLDFLKFFATF